MTQGGGNGSKTTQISNKNGQPPSGLYIDSRKPKRPLGSESYKIDAPSSDLTDFMSNY